MECVQTDNGFAFTNRLSISKRNLPTLFEAPLLSLASITSSPALYATPQQQGGAQPLGGPETLLLLPQLLLPGRLCKAAFHPQPPLQQLLHEASGLDVSLTTYCPICLTNLHIQPCKDLFPGIAFCLRIGYTSGNSI